MEKNPFFSESPTNAKWNEKVSERITALKGLMKTGQPDAMARFVALGLSAEGFQALFQQERAKRLAAESELKERAELYPAPRGASSSGPRPAQKSNLSDDQLMDSIFN